MINLSGPVGVGKDERLGEGGGPVSHNCETILDDDDCVGLVGGNEPEATGGAASRDRRDSTNQSYKKTGNHFDRFFLEFCEKHPEEAEAIFETSRHNKVIREGKSRK